MWNAHLNSRAFWGLFLAGIWVGMVQMIHPVGYGFGPGFEMAVIARNLAAHGTFGDPFLPAVTGPTAVVPPLHPFFLAIFFRFFQAPWTGLLPTLANMLANSLTAALMLWLSAQWFGRNAPGVFAGLLWLAAMRLTPQFDAGFTLAALVLFAVLTARSIAGETFTARTAAAAGLAGGVISLANPATVLVFAPWIFFLMVRQGWQWKAAVRHLAIFALMVALCNMPWMVRNYGIWHAFALRTNFGMTLYSSNNDCAQSSLLKDAGSGCYQQTHPVASESEAALLRQLGEVAFDRQRTALAMEWIRSHPNRFAELTLARVKEFWFPEPQRPWYTAYVIWGITVLSWCGLILMARRRVTVTWYVLAEWLIYPVMYYIVVSDGRYRYPVIWTSLLPAGYFLASLWLKFTRQPEPPASPPDSI